MAEVTRRGLLGLLGAAATVAAVGTKAAEKHVAQAAMPDGVQLVRATEEIKENSFVAWDGVDAEGYPLVRQWRAKDGDPKAITTSALKADHHGFVIVEGRVSVLFNDVYPMRSESAAKAFYEKVAVDSLKGK